MRSTLKNALAALLVSTLSLGVVTGFTGCDKSAADKKADEVRNQAEKRADQLEENADKTREAGEKTADRIEDADARNKEARQDANDAEAKRLREEKELHEKAAGNLEKKADEVEARP
ncbi:MAG: hypothetical protein SGJ20_00165 [Planctomycetota bacterium]|nr:hypothetical protein [Planctomycetota bacterium]